MAQQQQQQSQGGDNSMAPVWITVLLFFALYFVWKLGHPYIVSFVFQINLFEAKLIGILYDSTALRKEISFMQTVDPASVTWGQMNEMTRAVGEYTRYPFGILLVLLAIGLYRSNITLRFRKTHSMKSLRTQEQFNWTGIMPVINQDIATTDPEEGPWAMAMSPLEFCRKHNLLKKMTL